jgi:putative heme-binding domain-containing protein
VALENMDRSQWQNFLNTTDDPQAIFQSALMVARRGYIDLRPTIMQKLSAIEVNSLDVAQQLALVRAYALIFIRTGPAKKGQKINLPEYPTGDDALDRELCELLVYLGRGDIIETTLDLMEAAENTLAADLTTSQILERSEQYGPTIAAMYENRPTEQGLALAFSLSNLENGWTPELRNRYFKWFYRALQKSGGVSYKGFVEKIRQSALARVPAKDRSELAELSGEALLQAPMLAADVPEPEGPGREWTMREAGGVLNNGSHDLSFEKGEQHFKALLCASCHTMNGQGGNVGPDLTQAGTRFSNRDILYAMLFPSSDITDQYGATLYTFQDGRTLIGRTLRTTDDSVYVATNPFNLTQETALASTNVASSEPSPVSLMPAGLINRLNEQELRDLMAYLKSGGDPDNEVYGE